MLGQEPRLRVEENHTPIQMADLLIYASITAVLPTVVRRKQPHAQDIFAAG